MGLLGWMALNEEMARPFDTYPFIAALQAPVIMMSQNRHAAKDRSDATTDYEVNVRAEMEIMSLHTKWTSSGTRNGGVWCRWSSASRKPSIGFNGTWIRRTPVASSSNGTGRP